MRILSYQTQINTDNGYNLPVMNKSYGKEQDRLVVPPNFNYDKEEGPQTDKVYNNEYIYKEQDHLLDLANGSDNANIATINNFSGIDPKFMEQLRKIKGINFLDGNS